MRKRFALLPCICAAVCIMALTFTAAAGKSDEERVEELLKQRTAVMNDMIFNRITDEEGEERLGEVETGALLERDMENITSFDDTDAESVENIEIVSVEKKGEVYDTINYETKIKWKIAGYDGWYSSTDVYSVGVLYEEDEYRLVSMELKKQD